MTVYFGHVWYEHGALQSAVLTGWQVPHGPHEGYVMLRWPDADGHMRLVPGNGWHSDRLSAELEVAERLRVIADAARDKAARIKEAG